MLFNAAVFFSLFPFFLSSSLFFASFVFSSPLFFLFSFGLLLYFFFGLMFRRDAATSITGQGRFFLLLLLYISFVTTMPAFTTTTPSCHGLFLPPPPTHRLSALSAVSLLPPHTCTSTNCPRVSSTCHHPLCCLCVVYPSMCIPYSISRCSLTLYGAHAGHQ
ncbi:hypothetical protein BJV74DRAFT_99280 [Russula compacta]|nr:hypothetical protein BJV74DRAFT_99280 [Russula compacta]